jgi:starch phosphorylase
MLLKLNLFLDESVVQQTLWCKQDWLTHSPLSAASIPEPQREAWHRHSVKNFDDKDGFERDVVRHVETTLARSMFNCDENAAYSATSLAFRDRLITDWNKTQQRQTFSDNKRVYYFSLEFLMGRALDNAMLNVGLKDTAKGMLHQRLAACHYQCMRAGYGAGLTMVLDLQPVSPILASESKMLSSRKMMPPLAMEVSVVSLLAFWTAWPLSIIPPGAMVFATATASSSRRLSTATR